MTPNNARKPAHIHPPRVARMRAMDHLITAKLTPRGYPEALIQATTAVARSLYTHHYSAFRSMQLALGMAERLQLTRKDAYQVRQGNKKIELGELVSFNKEESTSAKIFLSSKTDSYRPSYGHPVKHGPQAT